MIFCSLPFLFLFLPTFLLVWSRTREAWRAGVLLLGSALFYAWWRADVLALFTGLVVASWAASIAIERHRGTPRATAALWLGVGLSVVTLAAFKLRDFGVPREALVLPAGLSFVAFHAISAVVDVWRGKAPAARNPVDLGAFVLMFPHLVAGPVLRYADLAPQMPPRRGSEDMARGALRFMTGFAKKILVADMAAPLADSAFALDSPGMADSWAGLLAYAVQLYFDFSGYTDMAIGLALMLGLKFPENFDRPYHSRSIADFWRRWHMSLSHWLREYVYIPLGGSRKGVARTCLNLFLTLLLCGLWHGAGWTFVAFGAWHGLLLVAERLGLPTNRLYTLLAVGAGWVLFRAEGLAAAGGFFQGLAGVSGLAPTPAALPALGLAATGLGIGLIAVEGRVALPRVAICLIFLLALTRLAAMNHVPFLYFQF
jgi:alginate O-acetyltransferase complex protein AlgI